MGIKESVTVTQYNVGKLVLTGENAATLKAMATVELYNANDVYLGTKKIELNLLPTTKAAIIGNVVDGMQALEAATGWTRKLT
jgi:phage gp45-like